jgi:hypothetical protein
VIKLNYHRGEAGEGEGEKGEGKRGRGEKREGEGEGYPGEYYTRWGKKGRENAKDKEREILYAQ